MTVRTYGHYATLSTVQNASEIDAHRFAHLLALPPWCELPCFFHNTPKNWSCLLTDPPFINPSSPIVVSAEVFA